MNTQQYRNIAYLSDVTGTGFWRHIQQILATNGLSQQLGIFNTYTQLPILDNNYYKGISSVTVQRWISDQQYNLFTKFLKPVCDNNGAWLIYEIDDAMHYDEIPLYNKGRSNFVSDKIQENIKQMLNAADFVVVTTKHIKEYYHNKYGVPIENIVAVPNLLPKWWFGAKYNEQEAIDLKNKNKAKPRIGIVSSLSHYNVKQARLAENGLTASKDETTGKWLDTNGNEVQYEKTTPITDDIDEIIQTVVQTINDFKWVFFGSCPPALIDFAKTGKIEVYRCTDILNYPNMLKSLGLQAVIAPLQKNEFNFCKSPIKFLECCAIGVPLFATRCLPYVGVIEDNMLFDSPEELKEKLLKFKFMSTGAYKQLIQKNFQWLNSSHEDGDFTVKNYWLDDNINIWLQFFRLRRKPMFASFDMFKQQYLQKKAQAEEKPIYNDNGVEILK